MKSAIKAAIFLIFISSLVFAQHKISFGLATSVETALFENGFHSHNKEKNSDGMLSISGFIQYELNPKLFVRSGVGLSHAVQSVKGVELTFPDQINPATGLVEGRAGVMDRRVRNAFLDIPLEIGYRLPSANSEQFFFLGLGGTYHFQMSAKEKQKVVFADESLFEFNDYVNYIVTNGPSLRIFGGLEKSLKQGFTLAAEPYLRISLGNNYRPRLLRTDKSLLYDFGIALRLRKQ